MCMYVLYTKALPSLGVYTYTPWVAESRINTPKVLPKTTSRPSFDMLNMNLSFKIWKRLSPTGPTILSTLCSSVPQSPGFLTVWLLKGVHRSSSPSPYAHRMQRDGCAHSLNWDQSPPSTLWLPLDTLARMLCSGSVVLQGTGLWIFCVAMMADNGLRNLYL